MTAGPLTGVPAADALDSARVALRASGVGEPDLDAELLVAHALGTGRAGLRMDPGRPLDPAATRWLRDAVRRRTVDREPMAYLLGTKPFRRIELAVDPRVLIPRPETEHLVEAALGLPDGAAVHDACTGSGAVALALKDERPDLRVSASDVSADAVAVARANAERLGLDVQIAAGALLDAAPAALDAIVANPPYVRDADRAALAPDIARHEPALALFGGEDGLDVVRALIAAAAGTRVSFVALEIGQGQAPEVAALLAAAGFAETAVTADLAGIDRIVTGRR